MNGKHPKTEVQAAPVADSQKREWPTLLGLFGIEKDPKWTVVGLLAASAFLITIAKRSGYYGSFGQDVPTAISSLGSGYDWSEAWMSALSAGGYFLLVICLCFGIWWFDKTVFKNAKAEFTTRDIWIRRGSLCLLIGLLVPSALIMLGNEGGRRMAANRAYGYGHQRIPNIDLKKRPLPGSISSKVHCKDLSHPTEPASPELLHHEMGRGPPPC